MATIPVPVTRAPKAKKAPKPVAEKHTITITFEEKYKSLFDEIVTEAANDERTVSQYVLLFLRDNHKVETPIE